MFESLAEPRADAIMGLMAAFREDPREHKIDLGVGIYKDADGNTPVMAAIKCAEQNLLAEQTTKAYVAPTGSAAFCEAMIRQVFGADAPWERLRGAQAVGGSGALRVLAELMKLARPEASVWIPDPSWPNHVSLLGSAGFDIRTYPYFDSKSSGVDVGAMLTSLASIPEGDIVVLHGCCHNPTGADLDTDTWERVSDLCLERSLMPLVDLAYQGFGDGLEEDAAAIRLLASRLPEMVVAASCSKNFGLYRERVGAALILAANEADAQLAHGQLSSVIRANYSMPPDHGANVAERVLVDAALNAQWRDELENMRQRLVRLRTDFSQAMRKRSNSDRFDYIATQKGMFSRLPLSPEQINALREQQGIYIVGDGRINIAGLPDAGMDALASSICSVLEL